MGPKSELAFGVNDAKTAVVIRVVEDGREIDRWQMEAPELDQHIRALASHRAELAEQVPPSLDAGSLIQDVVTDPPINVSSTPTGVALLSYRHPGLGWLGLAVSRDAAEQLVQQLGAWLKQQANQ